MVLAATQPLMPTQTAVHCLAITPNLLPAWVLDPTGWVIWSSREPWCHDGLM